MLLWLFLYFFGVPAVQKFLDKKVLVVKSRRDTEGTPAPAVTIVVHNDETQSGGKKRANWDQLVLFRHFAVMQIQPTLLPAVFKRTPITNLSSSKA